MKSTVEQLSPTRVRINVEVPFTELQPDFEKAYKELAKQVRLPGFRPGKAPVKLLEARFGRETMLDQVVNEALPSRYGQAVTDTDVRPLGQPNIEVTKKEYGQDLVFTAEVDVRPEITPARPERAEDQRGRDQCQRRGHRRRTAVPACPVRHPDRSRTTRRDRRLRLDRPVGHHRR